MQVVSLILYMGGELVCVFLSYGSHNPSLLTGCMFGNNCRVATTRSTKVGYLMYLGNSNGVLLVLILSCCEDESMLLA